MRRYGDNVSSEDLSASQEQDQASEQVIVMFGGCGYGAGSFNRPPVRKTHRLDLFSFLGLRRKKSRKTENKDRPG